MLELHRDITITNINRCKHRNYYVPKSITDDFSVFLNGSRVVSLNGEWNFAFYGDISEYEEQNFKGQVVKVPTNWQYYGVDYTQYINTRYQFECKPPILPDKIPCGVYKKVVNINKKDKEYYLNFEGVDSCLYLFVNGEFVGFSEGSHNQSEFLISKYLIDGDNQISVVVFKWCVGSYLECQDKIRLSGIFRNVYILERESQHIDSYKVNYVLSGRRAEVTLEIDDKYNLKKEITVARNGETIFFTEAQSNCITFHIDKVERWNSETPNIYSLQIVANSEKICDYIGFRTSEIDNNVFKFNGKAIKLYGVNRHDSNYATGYYSSIDQMIKDLTIMKEHNINCIRTSHYPPAPEFLYLCDEMGFYVIDEADCETHGLAVITEKYDMNNCDIISDTDLFQKHIYDRMESMVTRDYNRPCVIMWSLGNESGFGRNQIELYKWLSDFDKSRVVHYESIYSAKKENIDFKLPLASKMYPSIEEMKDFILTDDRPLFLCEYSHAMGNSCGDIKDYYDLFNSNKRYVGGCVWEWCDHSFPINLDKSKPGYGGDFNDTINDGNFCLDGLVDIYRNPKTSLKEYKNVICPLKIISDKESFYAVNRYDFITLGSAYYVNCEIYSESGEKITDFVFNLKNLRAGEKILIFSIANNNYNSVVFTFYNGDKELGFYQHFSEIAQCDLIATTRNNSLSLEETDDSFTILLNNSRYLVNKKSGMLGNIICNSQSLLKKESDIVLLRAPIDNDMFEILAMKQRQLDEYSVVCNSFLCDTDNNKIIFDITAISKGRENIFNGTISYFVTVDNKLGIEISVEIAKEIEYLLRFGLRLPLIDKFNKVDYFGYGEDSYCDKFHHTQKLTYTTNIDDMSVNYLKPQESGSHYMTERVKAYADKVALEVTNMRNKTFSFNFNKYSIEQLSTARHSYDMIEEKTSYLIVDYKMSGIGSNSCGPKLCDKYKVKDKKINFTLFIDISDSI